MRTVSRRGLLLLVLIPAWPGHPAADESSLYLSGTNKLDYRRLDQGSSREEAFRNRLEITGERGVFSAWIRLESLQISDANIYDPYGAAEDVALSGFSGQRIDRTEVSKRYLTIEDGRIRATVGDFSHVFGRGLALSVFEDEELNYDTRLEGIRAQYEHDRGTLTALAGSHEGNRFRGVFVEPVAWGPLRTGASFTEAWGSGEGTDIRDREQQWGGLGEILLGPASLYAEYVRRDFPGRNEQAAERESGYAGFVSAVANVGDLVVSGEFRDFFKFEHPYNDPPTTLRQHTWTMLNRVTGEAIQDIPDDDVKGYLAEVEYSPGLFTTFLGSFGRIDADGSEDAFWETYGEAKTTWREEVFLTGGAAESEFRFGNIFEERITGLGEMSFEVDGRNSLTLGTEWADVLVSDDASRDFELPREFRERIFYASYGRSPWLQVTATYEDTTEDDPTEPRDDWFTVLAEIAVGDGHDINLSYGSERGGWKCTGGICFFEPEFEGFKVKWVARY